MSEVIIHIGTPKTGTTSTQNFLNKNRLILKKHGICYPQFKYIKLTNHWRLGMSFSQVKDDEKLTKIKFRENLYKFKKNIISAESFFALPRPWYYENEQDYWADRKEYLKELRAYFNGHSIKILLYIRRQDLFVESHYNQCVKVYPRRTEEISEFIKLEKPSLDYAKQIKLLEEIFGEENLIIRAYEKKAFINNDLIDDFLDACEIGHLKDKMETVKDSPFSENISYDKKTVDYKRMMNKHISKYANRLLQKDLTKFVYENQLKSRSFLTTEERKKLLDEFRESNEYVYKKYFEPHSRIFFSEEIKTNDNVEKLELEDFMERTAFLLALNYNRNIWSFPVLSKMKFIIENFIKKH